MSEPSAGFGKGINDYYNHYITLTDGKAGAVMAVAVAVSAALLDDGWNTVTGAAACLRYSALALLGAAVCAGAWTIYPRLPSGRRGLIFWEDVRSHRSLDEYRDAVAALSEEQVEVEYAAQNYAVSSVVHRKMAATRMAVWLFVGGVLAAGLAALAK